MIELKAEEGTQGISLNCFVDIVRLRIGKGLSSLYLDRRKRGARDLLERRDLPCGLELS